MNGFKNRRIMSEQDRAILAEIKKYLIIGFIGIFLSASGFLYIFVFRTEWEQGQMKLEIKALQAEKVDKEVNFEQMTSIIDNLKEIKKDLKDHVSKTH